MFLTENDLDETNTSLKVNPPLRTGGGCRGHPSGASSTAPSTLSSPITLPPTPWEKAREFELAPFGMIGLETSLSLVLTELVNTGKMSMGRMVELMAIKPRDLGSRQVQVKAGSVADLTVFDPSRNLDGWRGRLRVARRELRFCRPHAHRSCHRCVCRR